MPITSAKLSPSKIHLAITISSTILTITTRQIWKASYRGVAPAASHGLWQAPAAQSAPEKVYGLRGLGFQGLGLRVQRLKV